MALGWSLIAASVISWVIVAKGKSAEPFLLHVVLTGAALTIALELMSYLSAVTLFNIQLALACASLVNAVVALYARLQVSILEEMPAADHLSLRSIPQDSPINQITVPLVVFLLFIVLATTAFTAISSVPNTWDSMAYHLPRIEHWLQNGSLTFYQTSIIRQLESSILSEQLILVLRSICSAYPIANIVQWLSFCGSIFVVSCIVGELGGTRLAQHVSVVMMATLPMAILQSSSTQTDLVVAFFSLVCIYFLLRLRAIHSYRPLYGAILAAAMAFHAKGIAAAYLSGFIVVYGTNLVLRARTPAFWIHTLLAAILAIAIVGPQLHRNFTKFGSVVGPKSQLTTTVEPNWRSTLFNAARNLASNAGTTAVVPVIAWTGRTLNLADTDERYSFQGRRFDVPSISLSPDEINAPNPAHVVVLMLSIIICSITALVSVRWRNRVCSVAKYILATGVSVLLFCVLLKWQPWITRLQLGEFAIAIPLAAVLISYLSINFSLILVLIFGLQAVPALFHNVSRPIVGARSIITASPIDVMFSNRPNIKIAYVQLVHKIVELRPKQIGLLVEENSWEFPLWYLLRQRLGRADMPVIIHELNEQMIDANSDVIVYLDRTPRGVPNNMMLVPGFESAHLYMRVR
jgi:hypothetical protein